MMIDISGTNPWREPSSEEDWKNYPTTSPNSALKAEVTYQFSQALSIWKPRQPPTSPPSREEGSIPSSFSISSYNVLVKSFYPPGRERYPVLLQNQHGLADIFILQEVSDDFLFRDEDIRHSQVGRLSTKIMSALYPIFVI
jgi:hypothetical protein